MFRRFVSGGCRWLQRQPHLLQERQVPGVAAAIATLAANPRPTGCVKLTGADDLWRLRIRDYRIIYTIRDDLLLIVVVKVGNRKDVYRLRTKRGALPYGSPQTPATLIGMVGLDFRQNERASRNSAAASGGRSSSRRSRPQESLGRSAVELVRGSPPARAPYIHTTPWGAKQSFQYCRFRRIH